MMPAALPLLSGPNQVLVTTDLLMESVFIFDLTYRSIETFGIKSCHRLISRDIYAMKRQSPKQNDPFSVAVFQEILHRRYGRELYARNTNCMAKSTMLIL